MRDPMLVVPIVSPPYGVFWCVTMFELQPSKNMEGQQRMKDSTCIFFFKKKPSLPNRWFYAQKQVRIPKQNNSGANTLLHHLWRL